jgi:putative CocE/NonD family hydrolase
MSNPAQTYGVQVEFDVPATMRDGTVLRANVYRPTGDGAFPVLLTRMPYGKDLPLAGAILNPVQAARQGYIVVIQDTRGRFASAGEWHPFIAERQDGYDTVEWAAHLPGSNGDVGMYGASYFGFTQWAAARENPPHLKAILPFITWATPQDGMYMRGGAVELGLTRHWSVQNSIATALRRVSVAGDPRLLGPAIANIANQLDDLPRGGYADLPVKGYSVRRDDDALNDTDLAIDQRRVADYLDLVSVAPGYDTLAIPAFHGGGWYDIFLQGTLQNYAELQKRGRAPQKLIIGPWTHTTQDERVGAVDFGFASSAAFINLQIDFQSLELRWFDRMLKGIPNGIDQEQPVQIFVMGLNQWRNEPAWPLERAQPTPWYLRSNGHANTLEGDGTLSPERPGYFESSDRFTYDPQQPVPTVGGALLMHPIYQGGPQDQRPIERREDMLVFTSAPLEAAMEVTGPITVTLYASTSAQDTDFVARLVDVHPDGFARNLTDGIIRGRMRNGITNEALLTPGEVYPFEIDLWSTSNVFLPGHRIRLDITSSNFPRWDRNLNTAAPYAEGTEAITAQQTILHDYSHPSQVILPIVPAS